MALRRVAVCVLVGMMLVLAPAQRAYAGPIEDLGNAVAQFFGLGEEAAPAAATANSTVDPATIGGWKDWMGAGEQLTTNNVGRVWTDKSVYNDDVKLQSTGPGITIEKGDDTDFLVALSTLSSYSNLTSTTSKPLDIVLMLDVSGSMEDHMYSAVYSADLDKESTYYYRFGDDATDGSYRAVTYSSSEQSWGYYRSGRWRQVNPKRNEADIWNTQFYIRSEDNKITALRNAVAGFINKTAEANEQIVDTNKQHHVSIAKFAGDQTSDEIATSWNETYSSGGKEYHYTQRITALSEVNAANKDQVIENVKRVSPAGSTAADTALSFSSKILAGTMSGDQAREDAQKVVIFFTDGEPNHFSGFDTDVANGAVANARTLKNDGATVYTIGVFADADPSDTSNNFNAYMNGVSSNYPNATAYNNLGTRVDAAENYYYAAENADQLNTIFEDIFTEIETSTTASPTEVGSGDPTQGGYITFTDQLGSYMQVENFRSVLFNGAQYGLKAGQPTDNGNGTLSYVFEGVANDNDPDSPYPEVDMEDIVITVKRSTDVSVGDVVTVKIPAANIPISKYKVTQDANGNWKGEHKRAYPMVVFYGVRLKPEAVKLIADPDAAMQSYIASHSSEGKVSFYSNAYDKGKADGLTSAHFVPSMTNNFNRFAEDTPLFKDEKCTQPVAKSEFDPQNTTYYYQRTEYLFNAAGGEATPNPLTRELKPGADSVLTAANGSYVGEDADGNMYIKAESPRIQRLNTDIVANKTENKTDTATTSNTPYWEKGVDGTYDNISVYLGNNGKLDVDIPGTLSVTKSATVADGSVGPVDQEGNSTLNEQQFNLTVTASSVAGKTFAARVMNTEGVEVSDSDMTVTFGVDGAYTQTLKNGEVLQIMGLPAGTEYTVAETGDMPEGFALKAVDSDENKTASTGTIAAGQTKHAVFHNEYKAAPVSVTAPFKAQKIFDNWDNVSNAAQFDIRLAAIEWPGKDQGVEPTFPKDAEVEQGTVYQYVSHLVKKTDHDKEAEFSFGDITFDRAGTYIYRIGEFVPENPPAGVQYSNAIYRVSVTVTDGGTGHLSAAYKMIDESQQDYPEVTDRVAKITNTYDLDEAQVALWARKQYADNSGANPLTANKFTFAIKPLTSSAPVPQYQNEGGVWKDYEKLDGSTDTYKATNFLDGSIALGTLRFDEKYIVNGQATEYVYELWEDAGNEAGMAYDSNHYYAHVTVEKRNNAVVGTVVYTNSEEPGGEPITDLVFSNTYNPTAALLSGNSAIKGTKTLTGRDMLADESFGFTLTPDTATQAAIDAGSIGFDSGALNASVQNAKNGQTAVFSFGDLTFKKAGTYTFTMAESAWNGDQLPQNGTNGMTFDRHTCIVTIAVKLDAAAGTLSATAAYSTAGTGAAFHNTYVAQGASPSVTVGKTLTGRDMKPRDFSFKIESVDGAPAPSAQDASFSNVKNTVDGQTEYMTGLLDNISFNQDDAGKTFDYKVSEVKPKGVSDEDGNPDNGFQYQGVTYDENVYTVRFTPIDKGDGTMTVGVQVLNAEGAELNTTGLVSFGNSYAATGRLEGATSLAGTKTISGDMPNKDLSGFNFKLEQVDNAGKPVTDASVTLPGNAGSVASNDKGEFAFDDITFTKPGTYYFQVTEIAPDEAERIPGLAYDSKTIRFRVTAADNGDGTLTVTKAAGAQEIAFTNVYQPTPTASVPVVVNKKVAGANASEGQFTFKLVSADDATADAVAAGAVTVENETLGEGCLVAATDKIQDGATQQGISFGDFTFHKAGTYKFKISEDIPEDVPAGWTYDDHQYTITIVVTDKDANLSAEVSADGSVDFVNTYEATVPADAPVTTDNLFTKVLNGRDWKTSDSFTFTITPQDGAPAPEQTTATLTNRTDKAGAEVDFGFGKINFTFDDIKDVSQADDGTRTKVFTYKVTENTPADADKIAGITYDTREVILTVTLTDDGKGNLAATSNVANGPFTNTYASGEVDVDAAGGVQIVKTLTGRAIAAGDFEFTMKAVNDNAKTKFGADAKTVQTRAADLGTGENANAAVATTTLTTGLKFGLEDVGKTFTFEVSETKGGADGYTNDETVHELFFEVTDDGAGTLTVTAKLDGEEKATWTNTVSARAASDVVSIPFNNSYDAGSITVGGEGGVAFKGTKQLTGRPMVEGEFQFNVVNAADDAETVVATGANTADGTINFTGITYTTEQLNKDVAAQLATVDRTGSVDVYSYVYTASEDASKNDAGISIIQGDQAITVKVTDDRAGNLTAEVVYPDGQDGMVFTNVYGKGAEAKTAINGVKVLEVASGDNAPNIAGKYTFTLTGSAGAPMPAKTTATNDAAGNVSFGEIAFTMEDVFGAPAVAASSEADESVAGEASPADATADEHALVSAQRIKTFTYTVTESGSVAGVANDPAATKTLEVTVTDNGDGTISVSKQTGSDAPDFMFTNVYSVAPQESSLTGEGNFTITKTLDGRDMREGEFAFSLKSDAGEVLTATNDASGNVVFPTIKFTQPGAYHYALSEVAGDLGGVTYDKTVYDVTATVVDNGDGTLGVAWSVLSGNQPLDGKDITFKNTYQAAGTSIQFNAAKVLTGRDLKEGEFAFKLLDAEGKVLQTVKNGAPDGASAPVVFDAIEYDAPGEFDYQIVEVEGDAEGVAYDNTVFTYHVSVTDNGKGNLEAAWTEGETGDPVFRNVYEKPADPIDPAPESKPSSGLPGTGDSMAPAIAAAAGMGVLTVVVGACLSIRNRKRG